MATARQRSYSPRSRVLFCLLRAAKRAIFYPRIEMRRRSQEFLRGSSEHWASRPVKAGAKLAFRAAHVAMGCSTELVQILLAHGCRRTYIRGTVLKWFTMDSQEKSADGRETNSIDCRDDGRGRLPGPECRDSGGGQDRDQPVWVGSLGRPGRVPGSDREPDGSPGLRRRQQYFDRGRHDPGHEQRRQSVPVRHPSRPADAI